MIELHCHTTYSDGLLSPTKLVQTAAEVGVKVLAITDHDTMDGWAEGWAAGKIYGVEIIPGVELSVVHRDRSLHLLGFYPDPDRLRPPLVERLSGRQRRGAAMAAKLADLGYPIILPSLGPGMALSRPHIAQALVDAGYVTSAQEAFQRWLRDDGPAYVHYEKFSIAEGIALLRSAGAVPVWAHPYLFRGGSVEAVLMELLEVGLMGLEVYHPSHSVGERECLERWCFRYDLVRTGGSDYHGPGVGMSLNGFHLPLEWGDRLKEKAARLKLTSS